MNAPQPKPERHSLWGLTTARSRFISDDQLNLALINDLRTGSSFSSDVRVLHGKSVLLATQGQLATVLALIGLDGIASRILLFTPDLIPHLAAIIDDAKVDCIVTDGTMHLETKTPRMMCHDRIISYGHNPADRSLESEWVIFTSGTTGRPKMVAHTLATLSGPIEDGVQGLAAPGGAVWSTFYDVRRYGGMQILLRALIGNGSMVLSSADEPVSDFLIRLSEAKITHISGTPSHWRRALMSPLAGAISPDYVRLSGEVADQAILDHLQKRYPKSSVAHAFASTEAGVGFDVRDGKAGFPTAFVPHPNGNTAIEIKVEDGTLRIRSQRTAKRYLAGLMLPESDGFIDTGDLIEQRGDRYFFMGRREGVINVGGQKVFPEEVEDIITQHPAVLMARVWARPSPVTGALVAADVVLRPEIGKEWNPIRLELLETCGGKLARHKVPVSWRQVASITMTVSGKVQRAAR